MTMTIKIKGKTHEVKGLADASALYCQIRDESGEGGSTFRPAVVRQNGKGIARISYNGNVWPMAEWTPGLTPLLRVAGLFAGDAR